ncbi:uncharacterized protein C8A04DRAFT_35610 [Dichotomopilus funicola]|uniref:Steroid 5-alpha reductase C-terminal domain-containing protein n=1 Tax=Dichotomopilus funicola TaxID=1934379 RepID=A0AAN6ZP09_9PEZI|nr:hypothetical protein C8A04DRAFT_35610 [Dichotomopilus funicola]
MAVTTTTEPSSKPASESSSKPASENASKPATKTALELADERASKPATNPGPNLLGRPIDSHFLVRIPVLLILTLLIQSFSFTSTRNIPTTFLANLAQSTAATFAIQTAVAVPSILLQNEKLYDLSGTGNFVVVIAMSLARTARLNQGPGSEVGVVDVLGAITRILKGEGIYNGGVWEELGVDWRQGWVTALVYVWAVRLGLYTFIRSICRGGDSRFDKFRDNPRKFFAVFMAQGIWVTLCTVPVVAVNSILADGFPSSDWRTSSPAAAFIRAVWFTLGLWSFLRGFAIECLADWQLSKWLLDRHWKKHEEVFCGKGLWDRCRHPNYYGECLVWLGISMCSAAVLMSSAAQKSTRLGFFTVWILCSLTPYFVYKLLRNISIPVIEEKMDWKYMEIKEYRIWRRDRTLRIWLDGAGIIYGCA